jgi:hypothetical protein
MYVPVGLGHKWIVCLKKYSFHRICRFIRLVVIRAQISALSSTLMVYPFLRWPVPPC